MSLANLLDISASRSSGLKQGLSEERIKEQLNELRQLIAFFREYPDLLIDYLLHNHEYAEGEENPYNPKIFIFIFIRGLTKIVPLSGNRYSKCS